MKLLAVIFVTLAVCTFTKGDEYQPSIYGMQGLRVKCDTEEKAKFVLNHESMPGFDFMNRRRQGLVEPVEVLVAPEQLESFKDDLRSKDIDFDVFIEDVSTVIEEQSIQQRTLFDPASGEFFPYFPHYDEIQIYLHSIESLHRDIAQVISIGKSFQGRDIVGMKLSSGGHDKPAVFIDAGIHAREWLAPVTALYAIHQIVNGARDILDNVDIYVVPSINPDGYEYSHRNSSTRMWRKTRSTSVKKGCIGVDANRNFDLQWNTVGASNSPCSDIYAGPYAFSEPETIALRDFLLSHKDQIKAYLTFHSYGSFFLHPWGYTEDLPANEPTLRCVGKKATAALEKVRGTKYIVGSSTRVLYAAAGGSDDWVMGVVGADLAYTIELPGGYWGFIAPPKEILPVGKETFEAIKVVVNYVEGKVCQKV